MFWHYENIFWRSKNLFLTSKNKCLAPQKISFNLKNKFFKHMTKKSWSRT